MINSKCLGNLAAINPALAARHSNKYLNNFWRSPGVPLINCAIELILTWTEKCILSLGHNATFQI